MTAHEPAAAKIRERFPDVRVTHLESLFHYGLGVELMVDGEPLRNACLVGDDTPENWLRAADLLIGWLAKREPSKPS